MNNSTSDTLEDEIDSEVADSDLDIGVCVEFGPEPKHDHTTNDVIGSIVILRRPYVVRRQTLKIRDTTS